MRDKGLPRTHAELAELAKRQHGVVSIRQSTGPLGYSEAAVRRAVATGRLHRLHRGVYAVGHTRLTPQGHCLAAVLACGRGALLSHDSGAWLWGISTVSPDETHGTREAFECNRFRDEELKLAGIELIRITGTRLEREPTEVLRRVARLLSHRTPTTGRKPT